jgi:hypothetical protein
MGDDADIARVLKILVCHVRVALSFQPSALSSQTTTADG